MPSLEYFGAVPCHSDYLDRFGDLGHQAIADAAPEIGKGGGQDRGVLTGTTTLGGRGGRNAAKSRRHWFPEFLRVPPAPALARIHPCRRRRFGSFPPKMRNIERRNQGRTPQSPLRFGGPRGAASHHGTRSAPASRSRMLGRAFRWRLSNLVRHLQSPDKASMGEGVQNHGRLSAVDRWGNAVYAPPGNRVRGG